MYKWSIRFSIDYSQKCLYIYSRYVGHILICAK